MPIAIQPLVPPAVAVAVSIGEFTIQAREGWYRATLLHTDAGGSEVGRSTCQGALHDPQGVPRFPPDLYAQIRAALYALAIADGCITPASAS